MVASVRAVRHRTTSKTDSGRESSCDCGDDAQAPRPGRGIWRRPRRPTAPPRWERVSRSSRGMNCSSGRSTGMANTTRPRLPQAGSSVSMGSTTPTGSGPSGQLCMCRKKTARARANRSRLLTRSSRREVEGSPPAPRISKEGLPVALLKPMEPLASGVASVIAAPRSGEREASGPQCSAELLLLLDHAVDDRGEDQLHGKAHLAAIHNNRGGAGHE